MKALLAFWLILASFAHNDGLAAASKSSLHQALSKSQLLAGDVISIHHQHDESPVSSGENSSMPSAALHQCHMGHCAVPLVSSTVEVEFPEAHRIAIPLDTSNHPLDAFIFGLLRPPKA